MRSVSPWTAIHRPDCKVLVTRCHVLSLSQKSASTARRSALEQRFDQALPKDHQPLPERNRIRHWRLRQSRLSRRGPGGEFSRLGPRFDEIRDAAALGRAKGKQVIARAAVQTIANEVVARAVAFDQAPIGVQNQAGRADAAFVLNSPRNLGVTVAGR